MDITDIYLFICLFISLTFEHICKIYDKGTLYKERYLKNYIYYELRNKLKRTPSSVAYYLTYNMSYDLTYIRYVYKKAILTLFLKIVYI